MLEESDIVALRNRCADAGVRFILTVDAEGEASFLVGGKAFLSLPGAQAHLDAMEDRVDRNAALFGSRDVAL